MRFIHIFTLREKKTTRQLPIGAYLKEIMDSKIISKTKERSDLRRAIPNLHQSSPMRCHEQPELAPFTPLWLGMSAHTDCSSIARAVSRKGWVMCLPYVSHYAHTWLFRKETPSWQSKAKLSGAQILHDLHKNWKWKIKIQHLNSISASSNLLMYSSFLLHIL